MIPTHLSRPLQALLLTAALATLAAPAVRSAARAPSSAPDWFERYVAAHPFGNGVVDSAQTPDFFERYVATHPFSKESSARHTQLSYRPTLTRHARRRSATVRQRSRHPATHSSKLSTDAHPTRSTPQSSTAARGRPAQQLRLGRRRHRRNRGSHDPQPRRRLDAAPDPVPPTPTSPSHITHAVATADAGRATTRPALFRTPTGSRSSPTTATTNATNG